MEQRRRDNDTRRPGVRGPLVLPVPPSLEKKSLYSAAKYSTNPAVRKAFENSRIRKWLIAAWLIGTAGTLGQGGALWLANRSNKPPPTSVVCWRPRRPLGGGGGAAA